MQVAQTAIGSKEFYPSVYKPARNRPHCHEHPLETLGQPSLIPEMSIRKYRSPFEPPQPRTQQRSTAIEHKRVNLRVHKPKRTYEKASHALRSSRVTISISQGLAYHFMEPTDIRQGKAQVISSHGVEFGMIGSHSQGLRTIPALNEGIGNTGEKLNGVSNRQLRRGCHPVLGSSVTLTITSNSSAEFPNQRVE